MAPYPQIVSRGTTDNGSNSTNSNPVTPEIIAGLVFVGAILLGLAMWLGIRYYRKRTRQPHDLIVKGVISDSDEKDILPRCVPVL